MERDAVPGFDWDPIKRQSNLDKHGLDFVRVTQVFDDPQRLDEDSTRPEHRERRRKTIGRVGQLVICVIYTDRGDARRIISARRAKRGERERYRQSAEAS